MAKILLLGLDDSIARKIETVSSQAQHSVDIEPMRSVFTTHPGADLVFVSGDQDGYLNTLRSILSYAQPPAVVVVTRVQKMKKWLDALEAGAADYCSAPFDAIPIKWVLDSALNRPKAFAAA